MTNLLRLAALAAVFLPLPGNSHTAPLPPGRGAMLHAHNCYPEQGLWADRIERALDTGARPIAIEQDVAWDARRGAPVVSHEPELSGAEPTLEAYFFDRMAPILDRALAEGRSASWPLYVLHLDFKTNEPDHHRAIWALLGKYERWLTTARRGADAAQVQPFAPGPLLVLTENGDNQAATFHDVVPAGGRLRIFGTLPSAVRVPSGDREAQLDAVFHAPPATLIPGRATNYRRWTNFAWAAVERGGQARAGAWTPADHARLKAIVDRAHAMGLWVRFYTLNGHAPGEGLGWTESYNFGSIDAVRPRWRAAIETGLDFVATDQYEAFARELARPPIFQQPGAATGYD